MNATKIVLGALLVAGGVWAAYWFFAVFGASLSSPGGILMGGLMVLLPLAGSLTIRGALRSRRAR